MPTGYTADVEDGKITTLRGYALTCARAFGALIDMRDDPMSKPIPQKIEPRTDYYDTAIAEARDTLAKLPALSDAECEAMAEQDFEAALAQCNENEMRKRKEAGRYANMKSLVDGWKVPDDLRGLRDFMLEQIATSTRHSDYEYPMPVRRAGTTWRSKKMEDASASLARNEAERAKEISRAEDRNAWLQKLFVALEGYEP